MLLMKTNTFFRYILPGCFSAVLLLSCRKDDLSQEQITAEKESPSLITSVNLDGVPIMPLQEQDIVSSDNDEEKPSIPTARALKYTVEGKGDYPTLTFEEGTKIPVRVLLYPKGSNYYGKKVFYSKNKVNLVVKKGRVYLSEEKLEFLGGKYQVGSRQKPLNFSGELAYNNDWMLTVLYAPNSTESGDNKSIISFSGKSPAKFLKKGDQLTIGTDIDIPFVLGRIEGGERKPGIPVKIVPNEGKIGWKNENNPQYNNSANYSFEFRDAKNVGFYPLGTLFAMRFQNDMQSLLDLKTLMDSKYWEGNNGAYQAKLQQYDYSISKVSIHSTTTKGTFDIGKSVDFQPTETTVHSFTPSEKVYLNKNGDKTPWLYFWQYSQGGDDQSAVEITFNLFNESLGIKTIEKVYRAAGKNFKNSHKYYKNLKIARELRLPPLATIGAAPISFNRDEAVWGYPWGSNAKLEEGGNRGIGGVYLKEELEKFRSPFKIKPTSETDSHSKKDLWWVLPNLKVLKGIFPASIGRLTVTDQGEPVEKVESHSEGVVVNGVLINDKAVYYGKAGYDITGRNQKDGTSLRVYYAIRYIGEQYVSAYRYIEWGKWNNKLSNPNDQPIASKFIIQSRSLPLSAGADVREGVYNGNKYKEYLYNDSKAKAYVKDVISKNSFWSDKVKDNEQLTIHNVTEVEAGTQYLKPDVMQRTIPLAGEWPYGARLNPGSIVNFWLYPEGNRLNYQAFQISNRDRANLTTRTFSASNKARAMIFPVLMPGQ